ncbi:unnamed protein product [Oikopleura dioica]|uniref:Uncharacterized protein n=1 Tax=Oikopleura dioica TaxID=34765 RepID=E4XZ41_OIKDI|nr:unnamed protein product [Oikopleura dioica]
MIETKRLRTYAIAALGATSFIFALSAVSSEVWWTSEKGSHGIWTIKMAEKRIALRIGEYRGYKGLEAVRGFQLTNTLILLAAGIFSLVKAVKGVDSRARGIGSAFAASFTFSVFTIGSISAIDPIKYLGKDFSYGPSYVLSALQMVSVLISAVLCFLP